MPPGRCRIKDVEAAQEADHREGQGTASRRRSQPQGGQRSVCRLRSWSRTSGAASGHSRGARWRCRAKRWTARGRGNQDCLATVPIRRHWRSDARREQGLVEKRAREAQQRDFERARPWASVGAGGVRAAIERLAKPVSPKSTSIAAISTQTKSDAVRPGDRHRAPRYCAAS